MKLNGEWIRFDEEQMKKPMESGAYLCLCGEAEYDFYYFEVVNYISHEIADDPEKRERAGIDGDIFGKIAWMKEHPDSAGAFYGYSVDGSNEWYVEFDVIAFYEIPARMAAKNFAKLIDSQKEQAV